MATLANVKEQVKRLRGDNALVFVVFSDLHADAADSALVEALLQKLQTVTEKISPDAVIDLGDNLDMLGRRNHITNADLTAVLTRLFDRIHTAVDGPLFLINGNHDGIGTDFFKPHFWNAIVKGKYDNGMARYGTEGAYYYVDYPDAKTRLIFLSVPYESDLEKTNPHPLWAFGEEQLGWLRDVALDTAYDVLVFSHVPPYFCYRDDRPRMLEVWDGEKTALSHIRDLCGWIDDAADAAAILEKSGKAVGWFSGHTHNDEFWMPKERRGEDENPLSCRQSVIDRAILRPDGQMHVPVDVLVWVPDAKQMHIFRVGEEERVIQYTV